MMDTMDGSAEYYGNLVAFEGPRDIVSSQLRLLPNSPSTLVLPPVECAIDESNEAGPFNARAFILATHVAFNARAEMARSFLEESTPGDKRLVFLNGGTATAYMGCIAAISKHQTNGDIAEAETIFRELIQNGVAGLEGKSRPKTEADMIPEIPELEATEIGLNGDSYAALNDPASNAMRAANALDLETASLQSLHVLDLTYDVRPLRPRSTSVPNLPVIDDVQDLKRHPLPSMIRQSQILKIEKWRSTAARENQLTDPNSAPRSPSCAGEVDEAGPLAPADADQPHDMVGSGHGSPAVVGKALLVDIRAPSLSPHKPSLSPDQVYPGAGRNRDMRLSNITLSALTGPAELPDTNTITEKTDSPSRTPLRSRFNGDNASAPLIKPNKKGLRRGPSLRLSTQSPKQSRIHVAQLSAVEGNNNVIASARPESPRTETANSGSFLYLEDDLGFDANEPFQTALPMMEDMIIYFKEKESEPRLEAMIEAFRNGTYPISTPPQLQRDAQDPTAPSSPPKSRNSTPNPGDGSVATKGPAIVGEINPAYDDEYDPFAARGNYVYPPTTAYLPKQRAVATTQIVPAPPTPAQTPPPQNTNTPTGTAIHDFNVAGYKTAVSVQNSLRTLLGNHFPSEGHGYQFSFPLLPGLDGFWRPVFRENSSENLRATRKVDLILAVGTQQGVDRDLFNAVSSALMKLGMEPDGQSRSVKLDIRYLVANAMQAFTAQRLTRRAHGNPFSDPEQLATLMVPHLETYLAAHSTTRFLLLEYPAEHLPTVLALQQVVGAGLLKVAGIVDARRRNYMGFHHQPAREWDNSPGGVSQSQILFAKVNFILAASASHVEIAKFIANIWGILIGISPMYAPTAPSASGSPPRKNGYGLKDYSLEKPTFSSLSSSSLMIHIWNQYPPLAEAAVMLGFAPSAAEIEQQRQQKQQKQQEQRQQNQRHQPSNYVSTGTCTDFPPPLLPTLTSQSPQKSRIPSSLPSLTLSPTSPTSATFRSPLTPSSVEPPEPPTPTLSIADSIAAQQNARRRAKLRNLLGRDVVAAALKETGDSGGGGGVVVGRDEGERRGDDAVPYIESDYDDDDDPDYDNDAERKYMPLWKKQMSSRRGIFGCRGGDSGRNGSGGGNGNLPQREGSVKARKWLGLSS